MNGTIFEDSGATEALNKKLEAIMQGQETLRKDINTNIIKQSQRLASVIDDKISGLRTEINSKVDTILADLHDLQTRVAELKKDRALPRSDDGDAGNINTEVTELRRRVDDLASRESGGGGGNAGSVDGRAPTSVIIKGLPESEDETKDDIIRKCQQLLDKLQANIDINTAERLGETGRGRRPRPVVMGLTTLEDVKTVMRKKRQLKDIQGYTTIYIEPMRSAEVRAMENNIRRLAKELPNVEYRRGRVQSRNAAPAASESGEA